MKSKILLLAAALFIACSDDSSSTSANNITTNNGQNIADPSYTNCIRTILELQSAEFSFFSEDGLFIDSAYWDKGTANNRGNSIYIYKAYWTDTHLDSTYEANLRDGEWTYQTTINTTETKFIREGNISTLISTKDGITVHFSFIPTSFKFNSIRKDHNSFSMHFTLMKIHFIFSPIIKYFFAFSFI